MNRFTRLLLSSNGRTISRKRKGWNLGECKRWKENALTKPSMAMWSPKYLRMKCRAEYQESQKRQDHPLRMSACLDRTDLV
eukprot:23583_5